MLQVRESAALLAAFLLLITGPAWSADLQAWNTGELNIKTWKRVRWDFAGTLRSRQQVSEPYDARLGTVFRFTFTDRLNATAGYLRRFLDSDGQSRHQNNRYTIGPRYTFLMKPLRVDAVFLYERHTHFRAEDTAFNRYKYIADIERTRPGLSPFLYVELLVRDGFARSRHLAGFRWRDDLFNVETGYQFETIRMGANWVPRHSIRTNFRWNRPLRERP